MRSEGHDERTDDAGSGDRDLDVEITEGTDIPPALARRTDDTKVAEPPQRPTSAETEFIGSYYSEAPIDPEALLGWNDVARVESPIEGTVRTPRQRLFRRLTFTAVVCGLLAVIAASWWEVARMEPGDLPRAGEAANGGDSRQESAGAGSDSPAPVERTLSPELPDPDRGEKAEDLLAAVVQEVAPDGEVVDVRLGRNVIERKKVTLVNLWATYCKPCTKELPGLRSMFERAGWGDAVRFVPIQVSDARDPVWARQEYIERMPANSHFLSDSAGGVIEALRALKSAPEKIDLPVTVLLDCRRHVRRLHVGALQEPDFESLQKMLDQLHAELDTKYCKVQQKERPSRPAAASLSGPPRAAPPPEPAVCGNRACEAGETEASCCDCRKCRSGERCEQKKSHAVCVLPPSQLKDE